MKPTIAAVVLTSGLAFAPSVVTAQTTPRLLYERAQAQERTVRETNGPTLAQLRSVVVRYEALVHKYPASGYTDNALWQAGNLSLVAFDTHGQTADKRTALRLLHQLVTSY